MGELSEPTHQDMEEGVTTSATTIASPPEEQAPSKPASEAAIPDTPIINESIIPHQNPDPPSNLIALLQHQEKNKGDH